ncbi:MAG: vWA domain-containing protein [Chitinophagaceae bacterium]
MLQLQHPQYLYALFLLIPLTVLLVLAIRRKKRIKQQLGNHQLIQYLTYQYSSKKYLQKNLVVLIVIALLIFAATNLRKPITSQGNNASAGVDIMIALDVSKSMLSNDEKPTRLEKAKQLIYAIVNQLEGNRIGLVVFAGQAYLQMPLTADASAIKMFVSNANTQLVNMQGTVIGDALKLCNNSLDTKEKKYKTIVLITDGEDHDKTANDAVKELVDKGTILHTIGVGSVEGVPIQDPELNDYKRDANGKTIISKLNQTLLQDLANSGNGTYQQLQSINTVVNKLTASIQLMQKKQIADKGGYIQYRTFYPLFVVVAIGLLLIEFFMSERKKIIA